MLAFVLVLVMMLAYQVARSIELSSREGPPPYEQDQRRVSERIKEFQEAGYEQVTLRESGPIQNITFGSDITFELGSAILSERGESLVTGLAQAIMGGGQRPEVQTLDEMQVAGHSDNIDINNSAFPSNWELSTERATRIVKTLIDAGLNPNRIKMSATGYGKYDPRATNETTLGRAMNRRIEMRLIYSDTTDVVAGM